MHIPQHDDAHQYSTVESDFSARGVLTDAQHWMAPHYYSAADQLSNPVLHASSPAVDQASKRPRTAREAPPQRAIASLVVAVPDGHVLRDVGHWPCAAANCFMMAPLGEHPLDFAKKPLVFDRFEACVADPSLRSGGEEADGILTRTAGRSLHLRVTALPHVGGPMALLETGFAVIVVCRRRSSGNSWQPACLAAFRDKRARKGDEARTRTANVSFAANMEHCVDEASGRRIWGKRTSHVRRREKEGLKAVRLEPRGPWGGSAAEEVCFYVILCDFEGAVLRHTDGTPCIAQTNSVRYVPKRIASGKANNQATPNIEAQLAAKLTKMSLWTQVDTMAWLGSADELRAMLKDAAQLAKVGVRVSAAALPATAVPLASFACDSDGYAARVRAVSRSVGWHHADVELTDARLEPLYCSGIRSAGGRCDEIISRGGLSEADAWLRSAGVGPELDVMKPGIRASSAGGMMQKPRFRATRTVCVGNLAPQRILVDRRDEDKVYCLSNTADGADIAMQDRMQPLAVLADRLDIARHDFHTLLLEPYIEGFRSRGTIAVQDVQAGAQATSMSSPTAPYPIDGPLVDEEKVFLLLHVLRLADFVHSVQLRDADRVRRLYAKLLQDDQLLDASFFAPGLFVPFQA